MTANAKRTIGLALGLGMLAGSGLVHAQLAQAVGTWAHAGAIGDPRSGAAAVTLADNRTLMTGGQLADGTITVAVVLYDPATNAFTAAGRLLVPRIGHTATLLEDGHVLVTGGTVDGLVSADIEIFDPATGSSRLVSTLAEPRTGHAAARLADGRVLIAGGTNADSTVLNSTELFAPATGSVITGASMGTARAGASATTLIDGRVLIAGGHDGTQELASAEIYEAFSGTFTPADTTLGVPRRGHTAVLLPHNNGVLVAGGTSNGEAVAATDLFLPVLFPDPYSYGMGSFASADSMAAVRTYAIGGAGAAEGYAFVAGGGSADAEVYRFATIKTDKDDYAPGELAIITGSGWQPGEDVTLVFQEDPAVHEDYVLTVTADAEGNIYYDQWAPEEHDLGVRFYLMALDSMSRAQTTFTDSLPQGLTLAPGTLTVNAGDAAVFSASVAMGGNSGQCTITLEVIAGLPAGAEASFNSNPFTTNANFSRQLNISMATATTPGTYQFTVRATRGSNCQGSAPSPTATGTLIVTAAAVDTTIAVSNRVATYGDASVLLSATVSSPSDVNEGTVTFTVKQSDTIVGVPTTSSAVSSGVASVSYALPAGTAAGDYTIEAEYSGGAEFNDSTGTGTLTIDLATLDVNAVAASKTYGQADPAFTYALAGFAFSEDVTSAGLTGEAACTRTEGQTVAGSPYTITCAPGTLTAANYLFTTGATADFTINPATLSVNAVAASKTYGQADPAFTYALAGFAFSEDVTSAGVTGEAACTRTAGETVAGSLYTITCAPGTLAAANYVFATGATANFTIHPAPLTVTATDQRKVFGATLIFTGTEFTTSGLVTGDSVASVTLASLGAPAGAAVGTYAIVPSNAVGVGLSNYDITFVNGTLTVHYAVCVHYDQSKSHQRNSTIPIKIALCDAGGHNVSSPDTIVQAVGLRQIGSSAPALLAEDAGNANPDYNFRYAGGFYIFNLSLKTVGVSQGEWLMSFAVNGAVDPAYGVTFFVK